MRIHDRLLVGDIMSAYRTLKVPLVRRGLLWESVAKYTMTQTWPGFADSTRAHPEMEICLHGLGAWFVIPRGIKKITLICTKRANVHAYRVRLFNARREELEVWDPVKEVWRRKELYFSAAKMLHRHWSVGEVFHARIEVTE